MTNGIKLTFISEEIPSGSLAVENFSLLSAPATGDGDKKYYEFVYSFEIRNKGLQPFELQNLVVQNTIIDGTSS